MKREELDKWVEKKESEFQEGSLILGLKKNPAPVDRRWKEIPMDDY